MDKFLARYNSISLDIANYELKKGTSLATSLYASASKWSTISCLFIDTQRNEMCSVESCIPTAKYITPTTSTLSHTETLSEVMIRSGSPATTMCFNCPVRSAVPCARAKVSLWQWNKGYRKRWFSRWRVVSSVFRFVLKGRCTYDCDRSVIRSE